MVISKFINRVIVVSILVCCVLLSSMKNSWAASLVKQTQDQSIEVLFLVPDAKGIPFWEALLSVMYAAADDLNIKLEVQRILPEQQNRFVMTNVFTQVSQRENKPDYLISFLEGNIEQYLLDIIEKEKIYFFSINNYIPQRVYQKVGLPREKYQYWLAHISPDEYLAGKELVKHLYQYTKNVINTDEPLRLLGLSALKNSLVSQQRTLGLLDGVKELKELNLLQTAYVSWQQKEAYHKTLKLFSRHQQSSIIWSVSDNLALGAISAIKQEKLVPNQDVIVGGIDWSIAGLKAIKSGEMLVSFGGHFLDGAKTLVLISDHARGLDFNKFVPKVIKTKLTPITQQNVDKYEKYISTSPWHKLNFKTFSLIENPSTSGYNFATESFFDF